MIKIPARYYGHSTLLVYDADTERWDALLWRGCDGEVIVDPPVGDPGDREAMEGKALFQIGGTELAVAVPREQVQTVDADGNATGRLA